MVRDNHSIISGHDSVDTSATCRTDYFDPRLQIDENDCGSSSNHAPDGSMKTRLSLEAIRQDELKSQGIANALNHFILQAGNIYKGNKLSALDANRLRDAANESGLSINVVDALIEQTADQNAIVDYCMNSDDVFARKIKEDPQLSQVLIKNDKKYPKNGNGLNISNSVWRIFMHKIIKQFLKDQNMQLTDIIEKSTYTKRLYEEALRFDSEDNRVDNSRLPRDYSEERKHVFITEAEAKQARMEASEAMVKFQKYRNTSRYDLVNGTSIEKHRELSTLMPQNSFDIPDSRDDDLSMVPCATERESLFIQRIELNKRTTSSLKITYDLDIPCASKQDSSSIRIEPFLKSNKDSSKKFSDISDSRDDDLSMGQRATEQESPFSQWMELNKNRSSDLDITDDLDAIHCATKQELSLIHIDPILETNKNSSKTLSKTSVEQKTSQLLKEIDTRNKEKSETPPYTPKRETLQINNRTSTSERNKMSAVKRRIAMYERGPLSPQPNKGLSRTKNQNLEQDSFPCGNILQTRAIFEMKGQLPKPVTELYRKRTNKNIQDVLATWTQKEQENLWSPTKEDTETRIIGVNCINVEKRDISKEYLRAVQNESLLVEDLNDVKSHHRDPVLGDKSPSYTKSSEYKIEVHSEEEMKIRGEPLLFNATRDSKRTYKSAKKTNQMTLRDINLNEVYDGDDGSDNNDDSEKFLQYTSLPLDQSLELCSSDESENIDQEPYCGADRELNNFQSDQLDEDHQRDGSSKRNMSISQKTECLSHTRTSNELVIKDGGESQQETYKSGVVHKITDAPNGLYLETPLFCDFFKHDESSFNQSQIIELDNDLHGCPIYVSSASDDSSGIPMSPSEHPSRGGSARGRENAIPFLFDQRNRHQYNVKEICGRVASETTSAGTFDLSELSKENSWAEFESNNNFRDKLHMIHNGRIENGRHGSVELRKVEFSDIEDYHLKENLIDSDTWASFESKNMYHQQSQKSSLSHDSQKNMERTQNAKYDNASPKRDDFVEVFDNFPHDGSADENIPVLAKNDRAESFCPNLHSTGKSNRVEKTSALPCAFNASQKNPQASHGTGFEPFSFDLYPTLEKVENESTSDKNIEKTVSSININAKNTGNGEINHTAFHMPVHGASSDNIFESKNNDDFFLNRQNQICTRIEDKLIEEVDVTLDASVPLCQKIKSKSRSMCSVPITTHWYQEKQSIVSETKDVFANFLSSDSSFIIAKASCDEQKVLDHKIQNVEHGTKSIDQIDQISLNNQKEKPKSFHHVDTNLEIESNREVSWENFASNFETKNHRDDCVANMPSENRTLNEIHGSDKESQQFELISEERPDFQTDKSDESIQAGGVNESNTTHFLSRDTNDMKLARHEDHCITLSGSNSICDRGQEFRDFLERRENLLLESTCRASEDMSDFKISKSVESSQAGSANEFNATACTDKIIDPIMAFAPSNHKSSHGAHKERSDFKTNKSDESSQAGSANEFNTTGCSVKIIDPIMTSVSSGYASTHGAFEEKIDLKADKSDASSQAESASEFNTTRCLSSNNNDLKVASGGNHFITLSGSNSICEHDQGIRDFLEQRGDLLLESTRGSEHISHFNINKSVESSEAGIADEFNATCLLSRQNNCIKLARDRDNCVTVSNSNSICDHDQGIGNILEQQADSLQECVEKKRLPVEQFQIDNVQWGDDISEKRKHLEALNAFLMVYQVDEQQQGRTLKEGRYSTHGENNDIIELYDHSKIQNSIQENIQQDESTSKGSDIIPTKNDGPIVYQDFDENLSETLSETNLADTVISDIENDKNELTEVSWPIEEAKISVGNLFSLNSSAQLQNIQHMDHGIERDFEMSSENSLTQPKPKPYNTRHQRTPNSTTDITYDKYSQRESDSPKYSQHQNEHRHLHDQHHTGPIIRVLDRPLLDLDDGECLDAIEVERQMSNDLLYQELESRTFHDLKPDPLPDPSPRGGRRLSFVARRLDDFTELPEGATKEELNLLNNFIDVASSNFGGNKLSADSESRVRLAALKVGLTSKFVDQLLNQAMNQRENLNSDLTCVASQQRPLSNELQQTSFHNQGNKYNQNDFIYQHEGSNFAVNDYGGDYETNDAADYSRTTSKQDRRYKHTAGNCNVWESLGKSLGSLANMTAKACGVKYHSGGDDATSSVVSAISWEDDNTRPSNSRKIQPGHLGEGDDRVEDFAPNDYHNSEEEKDRTRQENRIIHDDTDTPPRKKITQLV